MNKTILILAIFAICLAPALSAEMKENENRELAGVSLGNLKDIIGSIVGAIKNQTNNNNTNTNTTTPPATNNTNTNTSNPATPPVTNSTNTTNPVTPPASNNTNTTNSTTPTTPPVTNTTESDDSDGESSDDAPSTNTTSPTNNTNNTNTTTPTTPAAPVKYAKNDVNMATFKDDCMKVHNQVRIDVGLNNLTWSDSLAASAQAWAENMAKNGFRHSGKTGENIASSTYSTKTLSRLLGLWTKEKNHYIVGCKYPSCSSTSAEVGHYTQMVWWSTTQVGCGFAPGYNRGYNYLCCQYYKAGNIRGQYVYPVPTA